MAQQTPAANNGPSKETLAKVHQMKKKVEETIGYRLQEIQGRRLRTSNLEKQINSSNLGDDEKREILTEYVKQESEHLRQQRTKKTVKDFTVVTVIGKGAFGEVRIVRENRSDKVYAMKTMKKKDMVAKNQVTHILDEKNLMASADNPFLVKLFYSFQDDTWLYLVMEYCGGGDLMTILMREDILTEEQTRFYMAELSAAINAVHELDFVHRDLKPDNVLIANTGHVKLSDFGLAKSINTENDKVISKYQAEAHTLKESDSEKLSLDKNKEDRSKYRRDRKLMFSTVGTPDYIAPEVFSQKGYDKMVDWWSMGVIMFECVVGYPPFYADDPLQTCRKIVNYRKYFKIPNDAKLSREVIDLMQNLITSTKRRYGYEQIKSHPYFKNIQWNELGSLKPPFVPNLKSEDDSTNFEKIDSEQHVNKDDFKPSKTTDKDHFLGYTFTRPLNMNAPDIQKLFEKYQQEEDTKNPQNPPQPQPKQPSQPQKQPPQPQKQPPQPQKQNSSKQQIKKS